MGDARQTAPHGAPFIVSSKICSIWEPEEFNTNRRRFEGLLGPYPAARNDERGKGVVQRYFSRAIAGTRVQ
jgi:hypothetical protein